MASTERQKCLKSRRPLRRGLLRDDSGAALIEFAFVAAPLAALLVAVLEISITFFAQQTIETTTEVAMRKLMTGEAQRAGMTKEQFRQSACRALPDFMSCGKLMVDVRSVSSFGSADVTSPTLTFDASGNITNNWTYQPGTPGSINIVRVMYAWSTNRGPLGFDLSDISGRRRLLYATSVYKAEAYR